MIRREYPRTGELVLEEILPNGVDIRVVPRPGFQKTYAFFAANYGAIDRDYTIRGQKKTSPAGVAHFLEHKMFDMPDGSNMMQQFAAYGANPNAYTGYGMTAYYFETTDRFDKCLPLLLKYVSTPYFTEESVAKEQGIIGQEIKMYEDSPGSRVYENLFSAMFRHHPIRTSIAGTVESIAEITAQTLYDCHEAFYDPSNMCLCVVGDVEPDAILATAWETLPGLPGGASGRDYGPAEPALPPRQEICTEMDVSMPLFALGFKAEPVPRGIEVLRRELIGDLASELLMGESAPLYVRLYEAGLIDSGFSYGYEAIKGACLLSASGDSRDPRAVADAILEEARRLRRDGLDEALFGRLKKSDLGRRIRELDSFETISCRLAEGYFDGAEYLEFANLYDGITIDDVAAFLEETAVPERLVLSVVTPRERSAL